jgi:hypothetical protein
MNQIIQVNVHQRRNQITKTDTKQPQSQPQPQPQPQQQQQQQKKTVKHTMKSKRRHQHKRNEAHKKLIMYISSKCERGFTTKISCKSMI